MDLQNQKCCSFIDGKLLEAPMLEELSGLLSLKLTVAHPDHSSMRGLKITKGDLEHCIATFSLPR